MNEENIRLLQCTDFFRGFSGNLGKLVSYPNVHEHVYVAQFESKRRYSNQRCTTSNTAEHVMFDRK